MASWAAKSNIDKEGKEEKKKKIRRDKENLLYSPEREK
jgi:hypothetical protein